MSSRRRLRPWRTPAPGSRRGADGVATACGAVHDHVYRVGVVGDHDQAAGRDRRCRPGARLDLAGLVDSGVAIAHLPIDVRAAGAIGAEAVHALLGHDVHRIAAEGERVLDVLVGPQNPNDEGPVIEGSSAQVLTAGQRATGTGGCFAMIDRGLCPGRAAEAAASTPGPGPPHDVIREASWLRASAIRRGLRWQGLVRRLRRERPSSAAGRSPAASGR